MNNQHNAAVKATINAIAKDLKGFGVPYKRLNNTAITCIIGSADACLISLFGTDYSINCIIKSIKNDKVKICNIEIGGERYFPDHNFTYIFYLLCQKLFGDTSRWDDNKKFLFSRAENCLKFYNIFNDEEHEYVDAEIKKM